MNIEHQLSTPVGLEIDAKYSGKARRQRSRDRHSVCENQVRDSGVGTPPDKITAIFEPFIQLDRKPTSAHEGTGLGLGISRDLARAMADDLTAESTPAEGSAFTLELLRGDREAAIATAGKQD